MIGRVAVSPNLDGLCSLHQVSSHEGAGEDPAEASAHAEGHVEEAQKHGPVEGHQSGDNVLHRHVLHPLHLLLQTLY